MRKRFLSAIIIIVVLVIIIAFVVNQELIINHMYPQDSIYETSNLTIKGIVSSIERNYRSDGFAINSYHIFHYYIRLNITKIVWLKEDYSDWKFISTDNNTIYGFNTINVGYDNLDNLQLSIGQEIECKGYYVPVTDSPYSFILTVSPSINKSYLNLYY